ncbi:MAG: efflux RND transporter periplasmic adaptor subunit [Gammaproteobacteria bacterium]|nr:efflux RND transporter periplasmic adaptor subunit [Gammaproteobacteria bacterium]
MRWHSHCLRVTCLVLVISGCSEPQDIEAVSPSYRDLRRTLVEVGRTHLPDTVRVAMPVSAELGVLRWRIGDAIAQGDVIADLDATPLQKELAVAKAVLDQAHTAHRINALRAVEKTLREELEATVVAGQEAVRASESRIEAQRQRTLYAQRERDRLERLAQTRSVSEQALDEARFQAQTARIDLREAQFTGAALRTLFTALKNSPLYVDHWLAGKELRGEAAQYRIEAAAARVELLEYQLAKMMLTAPVSGVVIGKSEHGGRWLSAGTPLLQIGQLSELAVIADVLSDDALAMAEGTPVELVLPVGREPIRTRVQQVEPIGRTERSALGVKQQRVRVHVALPPGSGFGAGFRVEMRFTMGEKKNALAVPRSAVTRSTDGSTWVYRVADDGRVRPTGVQLGLYGDDYVEIIAGLTAGERVVLHAAQVMAPGQ